jgi:retron-type reverse transcriptase
MSKIIFQHTYNNIISLENLLEAWKEFVCGKRARKDVQEFERNLMTNIILLHRELAAKIYSHSAYQAFNISDPKPRNIHKASVRDRLLHHAVYRTLYPFFDWTFIPESYSCRVDKGVHKAINKFRKFGYKASNNHYKTLWVLKCDIRKFFASVDQKILLRILEEHIPDQNILWLLSQIIYSFHSTKEGVGLPLGNLTSQLLVNIYMNQFDRWVKHKMKVKYYIRYADDFVILSKDRDYLLELTPKIADFLEENLKLSLHPNKVYIKTFASGVDFLGWVSFTNHRTLRTSAKRRVTKALVESENIASLTSYTGLLKHGNQFGLKTKVEAKIKLLLKKG